MTNEPKVEMIPLGISLIERAGVPYTDTKEGDDTIRRWATQPTTAKHVSIKDEDSEGGGPVWLDDGVPLTEIDFDSTGHWSTAWYSRQQAEKIARVLGAELHEV